MFAIVIELVAAAVLILAGGWKLVDPVTIRSTVSAVGLPRVLATGLAPIELGAGVALILAPTATVTVIAILALAALFAGAGVLALTRKLRVDCACLGPALAGRLGWRQLLLFPVWGAVAAIGFIDASPLPNEERPQLLAAWLTVLSVGVAAWLLFRGHEHRTLRRLRELAQP